MSWHGNCGISPVVAHVKTTEDPHVPLQRKSFIFNELSNQRIVKARDKRHCFDRGIFDNMVNLVDFEKHKQSNTSAMMQASQNLLEESVTDFRDLRKHISKTQSQLKVHAALPSWASNMLCQATHVPSSMYETQTKGSCRCSGSTGCAENLGWSWWQAHCILNSDW